MQILNMGNEFHSVLLQSTRQSYLMLIELPSMITVKAALVLVKQEMMP